MYDIKLSNLSQEETDKMLPKGLILLGYRGSVAHGTYVPPTDPHSIDDKDLMGVFVSPLSHYCGLTKYDFKEAFVKEWDTVHYEVRKFISLLLKSNPNVVNLLWLDEKYYIYKTDLGQMLIDNREIFVSKKAYHSFSGYAYSQLRRMTYLACEGYMGAKRKALVTKFGYDTKNASHLIRLLEMCIEFLIEGKMYVERANAAKLIAIKNGEWTLEQVQKEAERLMNLSQEVYTRSKLPEEPDFKKAEELCMEIVLSSIMREAMEEDQKKHPQNY